MVGPVSDRFRPSRSRLTAADTGGMTRRERPRTGPDRGKAGLLHSTDHGRAGRDRRRHPDRPRARRRAARHAAGPSLAAHHRRARRVRARRVGRPLARRDRRGDGSPPHSSGRGCRVQAMTLAHRGRGRSRGPRLRSRPLRRGHRAGRARPRAQVRAIAGRPAPRASPRRPAHRLGAGRRPPGGRRVALQTRRIPLQRRRASRSPASSASSPADRLRAPPCEAADFAVGRLDAIASNPRAIARTAWVGSSLIPCRSPASTCSSSSSASKPWRAAGPVSRCSPSASLPPRPAKPSTPRTFGPRRSRRKPGSPTPPRSTPSKPCSPARRGVSRRRSARCSNASTSWSPLAASVTPRTATPWPPRPAAGPWSCGSSTS